MNVTTVKLRVDASDVNAEIDRLGARFARIAEALSDSAELEGDCDQGDCDRFSSSGCAEYTAERCEDDCDADDADDFLCDSDICGCAELAVLEHVLAAVQLCRERKISFSGDSRGTLRFYGNVLFFYQGTP